MVLMEVMVWSGPLTETFCEVCSSNTDQDTLGYYAFKHYFKKSIAFNPILFLFEPEFI